MGVTKLTKEMIDMVRKTLPNILAQELSTVQPMQIPTEWASGYDDRMIENGVLPYWVTVPFNAASLFGDYSRGATVRDITEWCRETFPEHDWQSSGFKFYFREEKQVTALLLRWS